jgi:hypothetical protein
VVGRRGLTGFRRGPLPIKPDRQIKHHRQIKPEVSSVCCLQETLIRRESVALFLTSTRPRTNPAGIPVTPSTLPLYTTPVRRSSANAAASRPQSDLKTSSVCSPNNGGRVISAGESDSLIGQPTV